MPQTTRVSRTQVERSAAMQARLLDATVASLFQKGYAGTTTLEVQQRAGVSRGALLHHYGSRSELMVAAVEHLGRGRVYEVLALAQASAPSQGRTQWAVEVLWSTYQGPLFVAALELWLAARYDDDLRRALLPQERVLGHTIRGALADLFGAEVSAHPDFAETTELLIDAMRGAAARSVLRTDEQDKRLMVMWTGLMARCET